MLDNPSGEEIFPNIQFKPPLRQTEVGSCASLVTLRPHVDG